MPPAVPVLQDNKQIGIEQLTALCLRHWERVLKKMAGSLKSLNGYLFESRNE